MRGHLAALAAFVVALLVGPSGVAVAAPQSGDLEPGTVQVQLSPPEDYLKSPSSPEADLSGVKGRLYGAACLSKLTSSRVQIPSSVLVLLV